MKRLFFLFLLVVIIITSATMCKADILSNWQLEDWGKIIQTYGFNLHPISGWEKAVGGTFIAKLDCLNNDGGHVLVEITIINGKSKMKMYPPQQRIGSYKENKPAKKQKMVEHFDGLINHQTKVKITYNINSGNGTASYDDDKVKHSINVYRLARYGIIITEYSDEPKKVISEYFGCGYKEYGDYIFFGMWRTTDRTKEYPFVLVGEKSKLTPDDIPKEFVQEKFIENKKWEDANEKHRKTINEQ